MDRLFDDAQSESGFFNWFNEDQLAVTASWGVGLMPQQRDNASSLDHEAQCPTLLCLRVLVTWIQHRLLVLISVPFIKGPSIGL